jgi:hypothetical protein
MRTATVHLFARFMKNGVFRPKKHDFSIAQCAVRRYIATARPQGQNLKGDSIHTWQQDR